MGKSSGDGGEVEQQIKKLVDLNGEEAIRDFIMEMRDLYAKHAFSLETCSDERVITLRFLFDKTGFQMKDVQRVVHSHIPQRVESFRIFHFRDDTEQLEGLMMELIVVRQRMLDTYNEVSSDSVLPDMKDEMRPIIMKRTDIPMHIRHQMCEVTSLVAKTLDGSKIVVAIGIPPHVPSFMISFAGIQSLGTRVVSDLFSKTPEMEFFFLDSRIVMRISFLESSPSPELPPVRVVEPKKRKRAAAESLSSSPEPAELPAPEVKIETPKPAAKKRTVWGAIRGWFGMI